LPLGATPAVALFHPRLVFGFLPDRSVVTMNTITIYEGQRGLYIRDGRLERVLGPGRYRDWALWGSIEIRPLDIRTVATEATPELERALVGVAATQADVVEVADGTVALVQRDGRPCRVLPPGRWIVWRGEGKVTLDVVDVTALPPAIPVAYWPLAGAGLVTEVLVRPYERVLVYVDGVLALVLEGGRHGLSPWRRKLDLVKLDVREQELQITGQELIAADKATLRLNLLLKYAVVDPIAAAQSVAELRDALYAEVQMCARAVVAGVTVDGLLERRVELAREMTAAITARAAAWGVDIRRLEIKDVILPGELKDLMNRVIEADKRAAAQVIMRREEVAATRSLANTARLIENNPVLGRLKEAEVIKEIAEKIANLTVVVAPKDLQDLLRLGGDPSK
jgi:regulator of protease activity HflC (stomatin/prohibitin superfamily)